MRRTTTAALAAVIAVLVTGTATAVADGPSRSWDHSATDVVPLVDEDRAEGREVLRLLDRTARRQGVVTIGGSP